MTMLLPAPANRAALRGYWLFVSLVVGLVALLVLPRLGGSGLARIWAAAAVAGLWALPGMLWPYSVWPAYRAWNRMAREVGVRATRYATAVCFRTVVRVLSRATPPQRFETASTQPSMWKARSTQPSDMYASLYHDATSTPAGHWTRPLRTWARSSGHAPALALVPFLWLIHALNPGHAKRESADRQIYTLY